MEKSDHNADDSFKTHTIGNYLVLGIVALISAACVNDATTDTLKPTVAESAQTSQKERYVASKCVSSDRLKSSNIASEALNGKFIAFSQKQDTLAKAKQEQIVEQLQGEGAALESLDSRLKAECGHFSACEYQASIDKRGCAVERAKFDEVVGEIGAFTKKINAIQF